MSLVGNLRDLDLGDVLQVIGLSRKSGVLSVTTSDGEGRVVLQLGRVVSAAVKTGPHDLQGVLMGGLSVPADVLEAAIVEARACSDDLRGVLIEKGLLDRERIDALCRRAIESAVAELFGWTEGEFCFEVRTYSKPEDPELLYAAGLDVQYLAMESARALDELIVPESTDEFDAQGIEDLSAEEMFGVVEEGLEDSEKGMGPVSTHDVQPVEDATPLAEPPTEGFRVASVLILVDPDPAGLDWVRDSVGNLFETVHAFQQTGPAMTRVRQYLVRGEFPVVLVAPNVKVDRLGGVTSVADFVSRMKGQSPRLRALWLCESGQPSPAFVEVSDGCLIRPDSKWLRDREGSQRGALGDTDVGRFRDDLLRRLSEKSESAREE